MKKITLMVTILATISNGIHGTEPYVGFGPRYDKAWSRPRTYAHQAIPKGQNIPKGYSIDVKAQAEFAKENPNDPEGLKLVHKKLLSGRNEYYNQFIEGYNPIKEGSEARKVTFPDRPTERLRLREIEQERKNIPSLPFKAQKPQSWNTRRENVSTFGSLQEPTMYTKFVNWLKAWWNK